MSPKLLSAGIAGALLVVQLGMPPLQAQDTGQDAVAGTGAEAVDHGAEAPGAPDAARGEDQRGFDPGWIGLAGLLGLAGLMGRDRNRRHDTVSGTTMAHH
jgi:hypothetical protein